MKVQTNLVIGSKYGLHSRPATKIVNLAKQFQSELYLYRKDEKDKYADCKSLLSLLMLGASQGTELVLSGKGKDAQNAIEQISNYFDANFEEI